MEDLSQYTDEELQKVVASGGTWRREEPQQAAAEPMLNSQGEDDLSQYTDEELQRVVDSGGTWRRPAPSAAPSAPAAPVSTKEQAIERARQQGEGETGFWGTVGGAALEGARGAGRAVKAAGQGVLGTATGVVRLVGTPVRIATGWDGIHRLADKIDQSYANFGADALMSEYGENPDGWGYALGRGGEKVAGVAGSLLGIGGPGLIAKAGKLPGAVRATGAAVQKALPFMFGNDAAVRAYDTARGNGRSKGEAAALAGLNGAIHFIGFKLFENKSLNKMLGMPQEMEAMMPKWAGEAAAAAPQGFNSLARSVRNGMIKYTLAERGKGMLKAGGIMGVQNLLSDPVMQVAEGKSLDDIDLSRTGRAGLEGLEEGALMEGLMGGAAIYKSPKAAREFIADKLYRGKDYKVIGSDGKPHNEPGLLETPQGRMFIMKQNPAATERVLDIVDHDGKPTKAELDAAFLPPDMSLKELKKFHDDWYNDLARAREIREEGRYLAGKPEPAKTTIEIPDEVLNQGTALEEGKTPPTGETNETRNGADEAPAQLEQGTAGKPEAGEAARPVEAEPPRAEAPREGVVEQGKSPDAAAPSATPPSQPAENGPTTAPKSAEAQTPAEPPKTPQEPSAEKETPTVEKPPEAVSAAPAEPPAPAERPAAEETPAPREETPVAEPEKKAAPAPTNRLKRADGTDPLAEKGQSKMKFTFHTSVSMLERQAELALQTGRRSYINNMHQMWREWIEPLNDKALKDLSNKIKSGKYFKGKHNKYVIDAIEEETRRLAEERFGESAAPVPEESAPEEPAPTNRLKRRDGTDPLAEKEAEKAYKIANSPEEDASKMNTRQGYQGEGPTKMIMSKLSQKINSLRNQKNGEPLTSADFESIMRGDNFRAHEKRRFVATDDWVDKLGLAPEEVEALRFARQSVVASTDLYNKYRAVANALKKWHETAKGANAKKIKDGAVAFLQKVLDAQTKATNKGDERGMAVLKYALKEATESTSGMAKEEIERQYRIMSMGADRIEHNEKTVRFDERMLEHNSDENADGEEVGGESDYDYSHRRSNSVSELAESPTDEGISGKNETVDDIRKAAQKDKEQTAAMEESQKKARLDMTNGRDLAEGNRRIQLETKGGKISVVWRNELGEVVRRLPIDALRAAAKKDPGVKGLIDKLEAGEEIRASKGEPETQAERDRRYANDADYQKWLKKKGANDADPLRQRYEMEQAKALGDAVKNAVGGVDFEYVGDRDYDPAIDGGGDGGRDVRHSRVTDNAELERLDGGETVKVYRAMQMIDGKLYPPMAAKVDGKLVEPTEIGTWYRADERPDLIKDGKFKLDKANGAAIEARYNPYFHTSRSPLNDQFSSANKRPNLVTVEVEIPKSELTSGYRAEGAKDAVGEMDWHSGPVSSKLPRDKARKVILSRWAKVVRVVPDAEVADVVARTLNGERLSVPENTVTPSLRRELEQRGVRISNKGEPVRYLHDRDTGTVLGIFDRDTGKLKLFRGANWKTLNHELGGHATMRYAEQEAARGNRALLDKINESIDNAPQWLKDEVKSRYPDADEAALRDEIWAALRERPSDTMQKYIKTLQGRAWYNRAWDAIKTAWKGILARMGFNRADLSGIDKMSPDEFNDFLDKTMAEGKTLGRLESAPMQIKMKSPEGAHLDTARLEDVAEASSSGDSARSLPNPSVERKGGGEENYSVQRETRAPRPAGSRILDDVRSKWEKFKEKFLDRLAPAQSVQDEIGGVEEIVGEDGYTDHRRSTDYVAAADKANGREEALTRNLQKKVDQVENDISQAALKGQDTAELLADFDLYAQCKHAAERNRTIAERNGVEYDADYYYGMGKVDRGGERAGLSENVANEIVRELRKKYGDGFSHFEDAQRKLVEINREDIRNRVASGRLSAQDANQYLYRWQDYVPLKTDMAKLEPDGFNSSTASMRRNEFMKARGRGNADIADSPFAASVLQAEQGIRGSVKNELLNVAANLVEHAADKGNAIGEIVRGETLPKGAGWTFTLSDGTKVTAGGSMRLAENRPDVLLFKRNGELMAIRIDKGANGRGLALSKAISGENIGRWGSGTEWIPRMTHWMSAMRTQYSPEFIVSNLLADHLEAYQALVGRYGIKGGTKAFAKMVASEISNFKALRNYLKTGMMTRDVGEAVRAGLLTKGGVASEGFEGKEQSIRSHIEEFRRKQKKWQEMSAADWAKSGWSNIRDFISFANEMAEYSTRMGIFSALKKQGVSVKDAVKFARDATVNFNRKGTAMPLINGLYMFANASVQGTVRSVQAMRDEHGKELVGLLVGIGVAKAVLDNVLGDDEEREKSGGRSARNLSDYDRKHNVGVPIPGTDMQFAPLRFRGPYASVPYIAQMATNVALGNQTPEQGAVKLVKELGDQVTDIVGGNGVVNDRGEIDGSLLMQSVAPSIADLIIQLASGKDYKGDERRAKEFDKTIPASSNGKRNTPFVYKKIAQGINAIPVLSGGNENRKGRFDFAPEDIQLIVEFLGAGPVRDIGNAISTGQNVVELAKGGSPERTLSQVPFVRRVVKEYPENTTRYYNAIDSYERDKAEFNRTTDLKRRAEFGRAHPQVRPMVVDGKVQSKSRVDALNDRVKELMHLERGEIKNGRKWVERKTPITEAQKKSYHDQRLELQAKVLDILGA